MQQPAAPPRRTAATALGRKTWTTTSGDFGLFELLDCEFGESASDLATMPEDYADGTA
ncbi:hypothetical protein AAHK20_32025 [Trinickia sp. YCB016]